MATTNSQTEALTIQQASLIGGRDEMNLAEFPYTLVADRAQPGQKTLYFEDKHGRLTITGSDAYGLPTAIDSDVIVALIYLTKLRNDFSDVKVNFSRYELIKLLNWPNEGGSYKRLDQSFNRWGGVWLVYDKCWWNNKLKCYTSAKMHIIENVEIIDNDARRNAQHAGQAGLPLSSFIWDSKFIESCQADNLRQLNLDTYFSLKSAVSKRLYRFLGKRFYLKDDYTFDLNEIAFDRIGLSRKYADAYKIKEKLQPAIEELEAIGFLRPLSPEKRYRRMDRGQWKIRLASQPDAAIHLPVAVSPERMPSPHPLIAELVSRGVHEETASSVVGQHAAEKIQAKVEEFVWLVDRKDKRVAKNPAGFLVKSITTGENGYKTPPGFVGQVERERQVLVKIQAEQVAAEERRRKQENERLERQLAMQVKSHRKSRTPEQLAQIEADAIAAASDETRRNLDDPAMKQFRKTLISGLLNEHIARLMQSGELVIEPA